MVSDILPILLPDGGSRVFYENFEKKGCKMRTTYVAKQGEILPEWFVVDAKDLVLGRLATVVAARLRGKHKPEFTPNQLCGDTIVVVNADKVRLTSNKAETKIYYRHTGRKIRKRNFNEQMQRNSAWVIETAVRGMLPKNSLGRLMFKRLKVYSGSEHPHTAMKPQELKLGN
jgi:large subunit ribosomal protein L13